MSDVQRGKSYSAAFPWGRRRHLGAQTKALRKCGLKATPQNLKQHSGIDVEQMSVEQRRAAWM